MLESYLSYFFSCWFFGVLLFYISLYLCVKAFGTDLLGIVSELNSIFLRQCEGKSLRDQGQKLNELLKQFIDLDNDILKYFLIFLLKSQ